MGGSWGEPLLGHPLGSNLRLVKSERYVALIDAVRLDYYHRLERERIHLLLITDAQRGLAHIEAGRTYGANAAIAQLQLRRTASTTSEAPKKRG